MKCIAPMVETISHGRYSNVGLASASVTFRCKSVRHFEFSKFEILTSTVIVVKFCALVQKFAQIRQFIVCGVIAKMLFQIWRLSTVSDFKIFDVADNSFVAVQVCYTGGRKEECSGHIGVSLSQNDSVENSPLGEGNAFWLSGS